MKLFKKMIALVAVAACCFTMATPVTANAALRACSHRTLEKTLIDRTSVSDRHTYYYSTDINGNGVPETVKAECFYVTIEEIFDVSCACGLVTEGTVVEVTEFHFDCDDVK